jgi:hypothetical protein
VIADASPDTAGSRGTGMDAGATQVVSPPPAQHLPYETRTCDHEFEYQAGKISSERLTCQDGSTRKSCTATLNRM